jgi:hypothetical protein
MRHAIVIAILLTGCSTGATQPASPPAEPPNHWTVVPNGPTVDHGITYYTAWRLDTQTGELALCTYDPGPATPVMSPDGKKILVAGPRLVCDPPETPH